MNWFRSTLEGAGLARFGAGVVALTGMFIAAAVGVLTVQLFNVPVLGLFIALGAIAIELETLTSMAKNRRRELSQLWPEVLDAVHSAISSGMTLSDAFDDLSQSGPQRLRSHFQLLSHRLDTGWSFEQSIDELKSSLGEVHADRLCEVLRLVSHNGSESLGQTLRQQAISLRRDLAVAGQIESKQGWVSGTAKIAVAAPWIVVALLATRKENAAIFNTSEGAAILLLGFVVCAVAFRLVQLLGSLPQQPRVFA
jgi:tight adherence protein B